MIINQSWLKLTIFFALLIASASILIVISYPKSLETELHIEVIQHGELLPDGFFIYQNLQQHGIQIKSITSDMNELVIRLASPDEQLIAYEVLQHVLPEGYLITKNTPQVVHHWLYQFIQLPHRHST